MPITPRTAPCWKTGPRATSSASFPAATRWPGCCPLPGATTATAATAFCPPPAEDTSALIDIVAKFCVSRENFHQKYEAAIMDMIQCAFLRSEKEVVDGYILSDGEIVERLQSLSHMKEIDYWQIVGSVWAASTMSRPILERYGQNVPLLARQILIPVLAVGLCYGIETDVVQMVAQYIIRLLTARGELDSVLRAAFCHHPENYISLMEYYAPEEHGMEPFTRK